jgi:hypothetical protein
MEMQLPVFHSEGARLFYPYIVKGEAMPEVFTPENALIVLLNFFKDIPHLGYDQDEPDRFCISFNSQYHHQLGCFVLNISMEREYVEYEGSDETVELGIELTYAPSPIEGVYNECFKWYGEESIDQWLIEVKNDQVFKMLENKAADSWRRIENYDV